MKTRSVLGIIGAVVLIVSSAMHSLMGWPAIVQQLRAANAPPDLITGLQIGWHFGGVAMLVFGVITLLTFVHRLKGDMVRATSAMIIGAAYTAFGVWALVASAFNPFFLIFIVPGVLLLAAAI